MKKLMTMIAAVATAFGLYAADADIAGINSFEDGNDAGVVGKKFTPANAEGWSFSGTETELDLGEYNGDAYAYPTTKVAGNIRRTEFVGSVNNQFLTLATGKEVLSLEAKDTSIFADQVVKFTGFEDAPPLADNTKIAVWMSEEWNDDETVAETNLYVSAYNTEEGVTNYLVGAANQYELGKWYRLTIKNVGNIMSGSYAARLGFVVYIDGEMVVSDEAKTAIDVDTLKDDATKALLNAGQLFPAITENTTFASVGYMGIGSVDDVVVDNQGPEFARSVDVSFAPISGATIAKVVDSKGNEFYNVSGTISVAQGNLTVTLAPAAGWKLAPGKGTYVVSTLDAKDGEIEIPVDEGDVIEGYAKITRAGVDTIYGEAELDEGIRDVQDDDRVTFLKECTILQGAYSFTPNTTIDVAQGGKWTVYVANYEIEDEEAPETVAGSLVDAFGAMPGKDIKVTFENGDDGVFTLMGLVQDNAEYSTTIDVQSGNLYIGESGLTVGCADGIGAVVKAANITFYEDEESGVASKITLVGKGKVITKSELTAANFEGEVESKTEGEWTTWTLKGAPATTGFAIIIAGDPAVTNYYPTLDKAIEEYTGAGVVALMADSLDLNHCIAIDKEVVFDLNGYTLAAVEGSSAAGVFAVRHGGFLTIDDSSANKTGAIDGSAVPTAIKMTQDATDIDDTKLAKLVVNGGTITGDNYGIGGNGNAGRGNTEVVINGGKITAVGVDAKTGLADSCAIFNPQAGDVVINGGVIEAGMGIIIKSGKLTVNAGTIKATGEAAAWVKKGNGFYNTGDAIEVDNIGYPGESPVVEIKGGTIVSENNAAIASQCDGAYEQITGFVTGGTFKGHAETDKALAGGSFAFPTFVADQEQTLVPAVASVNGVNFGTAAEALAAVQALEGAGDFPIVAKALVADLAIVGPNNQQIVLAKDETVTIGLGSWEFSSGVTIVPDTPIALAAGATFKVVGQLSTALFSAPAGYNVKEIANGDGTYTYTTEKIKYHGNYEIWDAADFADLQADVADGETFAGVTFTLINDVPLTDWEGIGTNAQQDKNNTRAFSGVFNGNGKTLTVSFARAKKYEGLFNYLTDGAVISNLTIEASVGKAVDGVTSFGIAAVAGEALSATIENVTVNGELGNSETPITHNAAGFVVICSGAKDTGTVMTFKDCVNNAKVYSSYNKAGGFVANASSAASCNVIFENCANTVAITGTGSATDKTVSGIGGIVGYRGDAGACTFTDCSNTGVITAGGAYVFVGSIVGRANGNSVVTGLSGNSAQADIPAVGYETGVITGLNFATVAGTTATFVADDALALNGSYKVMAPKAAQTFEFTEAGSISFDTNLVKVADGDWHVTAVAPLVVTPTEVDGIVTFTAAEPIPTFDITIAVTENGKLETSVTNGVEAGTVVTVTATPDTGYELDTITTNGQVLAGKTFAMPAEDVTVEATFKKAGPVYPDDWPTTDPETKAKYVTWATGKTLSGDKTIDQNAFLLNCDPNAVDVAAEEAEFKITKIEKVNGEWKITVKSTNTKGAEFNGKVVTKAFEEVGCKTEVPTPAGTETELFWKAFLDFPAPAAD